MERYQQPMVNILTRKAPPQQVRKSNGASSKAFHKACSTISPAVSATLTCPAGTPQDPSYLTIPFTAPSGEPLSAKEPKRPKEQDASMFIACSDTQLAIGMDVTKQLSTVISVVHWLLMHLHLLIANMCLFPGGDGGFALCLQEDLEGGFSEPCDTFKSSPLCKGYFKIQALEVWGIQNSISFCHSLRSQ